MKKIGVYIYICVCVCVCVCVCMLRILMFLFRIWEFGFSIFGMIKTPGFSLSWIHLFRVGFRIEHRPCSPQGKSRGH